MKKFLFACLFGALLACAAVRPILKGLELGAGLIGGALDTADIGGDRFFAKHPSLERESDAADLLLRARQKNLEYHQAILDGDVERALEKQQEAIAAYGELYDYFEALGVLDGVCRGCGGAESPAPPPGPLVLPTPQALAQSMKD